LVVKWFGIGYPPQTIIPVLVATAACTSSPAGFPTEALVGVQVSVEGSYFPPLLSTLIQRPPQTIIRPFEYTAEWNHRAIGAVEPAFVGIHVSLRGS